MLGIQSKSHAWSTTCITLQSKLFAYFIDNTKTRSHFDFYFHIKWLSEERAQCSDTEARKKCPSDSPVQPTAARMKIGFGSDWIFIYLRQEKSSVPARDVFINDLGFSETFPWLKSRWKRLRWWIVRVWCGFIASIKTAYVLSFFDIFFLFIIKRFASVWIKYWQ